MVEIKIDRDSEKRLYAQIRDALQEAIERREIEPGRQLPTVAAFARQIGVTQATIRRAYEDLAKSGLVGSHVGRGTFVLKNDASGPPRPAPDEEATQGPLRDEFMQAARRIRDGVAKSLDDLMVYTQRPGLIHFTAGIPDPALLRDGVLAELTTGAFEVIPDLQDLNSDSWGMPEIRAAVAERYSRDGSPVTPDMVLITNGSQQGAALMALAAAQEKRRVICEFPCYMGIPNVFSAMGHWVEAVPRDPSGPMPARLDRFRDGRPSLFYLCPVLHGPMGTDLSPKRREFVIDWAREQKAVLAADEVFRELRYQPPNPPCLLTDLGPEQTVILGSVSKAFMGGLRLGWLISDPERIRNLASLKRTFDLGTPILTQAVAYNLFKSGEYDRHAARVRQVYSERRDQVLSCLEKHMPDQVTWTRPEGGFHMWVELPPGYSSIALFLMAVERGVSFVPGPLLDIDYRFVNAFRLSFGSVEAGRIEEGIELLAAAVRELIKEPPAEPGLSGLSGLGAFL